MRYRICFRSSGLIEGREDFDADSDRAAMIIAELLWDACCDACDGFELWEGIRRVDAEFSKMPCPTVRASAINLRMQETLVRSEELIRDSRWAIARSRRLMDRMRALEADFRNRQ